MNIQKFILPIIIIIFGLYSIVELLNGDFTPVIILFVGILLVTAPKWASLGVIGIFFFKAGALQIPLPTDPDLWQFCGFLAMIGGFINFLSHGKKSLDSRQMYNTTQIAVFISSLLVLIVFIAMMLQGVKPQKIITDVGGRQYLKAMIIYALPIFVLYNNYDSHKAVNALRYGYALAITYVVMEGIIAFAPQYYGVFSMFFSLPHDAIEYAAMSEEQGYRRLSGTASAAKGLGACLIVSYAWNKKFRAQTVIFWVLLIILYVLSLMAGSRKSLLTLPFACFAVMWISNKIKVGTVVVIITASIITIMSTYVFYDHLPQVIQRTTSVLPGLRDDASGYGLSDTIANDEGRKETQELSMEILRDNWIFGVGYKDSDRKNKDLYEKKTQGYILATSKYDLRLATPMLLYGVMGQFFITLFFIVVLISSCKLCLYMKRNRINTLGAYILAASTSNFIFYILFIAFDHSFHPHFSNLPVFQLLVVIIVERSLRRSLREQEAIDIAKNHTA